jgi:hypothetical protein
MAALHAVAVPNASATPRAIVRIIDCFLIFGLPAPFRRFKKSAGAKLASVLTKTMTGSRGKLFIKLNATPVRPQDTSL